MDTLCVLTNFVFPSLLFVCCFCKRLTAVDLWDISVATRLLPRSPISTIGPRCFVMSHATPIVAPHVAKLSHKLNLMVYICHFLYHIIHGKTLAWILCLACLEQEMEKTRFLSLLTAS